MRYIVKMKIRKLQTLTEAVADIIGDGDYGTVGPVYADAVRQSKNVRELIQKRFEERKLEMPNEDRNAHAEGVKSDEMKKMKLAESLFNEWVEVDPDTGKELDNNYDEENNSVEEVIEESHPIIEDSKEDGFKDNSEKESKTIGDIKADFDKELYNMFEGQVTYDGKFGVYMFETPDNNKETAEKIIKWLEDKYQLTCEEGEKGRVWVANLVFADDMGEEILDIQKYPVNHEKAPLMEDEERDQEIQNELKEKFDDEDNFDEDEFDMYDLIYSASTRGGDANDVAAILKRIDGSNAVGYTEEDQFAGAGKFPITTSSDGTRIIVRIPTEEKLKLYTDLYDEYKLEYKVKENDKGEDNQYDKFIISVKIPMDPFDMPYCIGDYFKEKGLKLDEFISPTLIKKLAKRDQLFANPDDNEAFLSNKVEEEEIIDEEIQDSQKFPVEGTINEEVEVEKEPLNEVRINTEGLKNFHPWGEKAIETWKLILDNDKLATFESMLDSMNDSGIVGSNELNSILENDQEWVINVLNIDVKKDEESSEEDPIVYEDDGEELPMVYDDDFDL